MKLKLSAVVLFILSFIVSAGAFPLADSFEPTSSNWNLSGSWDWTGSQYRSPSSALTDSPDVYYTNNTDSSAELSDNLNLSGATAPAVSFYERHLLETGYDYGTLEISTDGGSSYEPEPLLSFTGQNPSWTRQQVDLDAYVGQDDIRLRFRLVTDSSVTMDGWYIDDLHVGERPTAVVLQAVPFANRVELSWPANVDSDFAAYRVYRSNSSNVNWQTASLLREITTQAATNFMDVTAAPKTRYYYKIMVLDSENLHALSNEVNPLTPAGSEFPFLDDGEGGAARWNPEAVWALSDESSFSATHAWSDSPGTNYADSLNSSLALAAPLDLSSAVNPVLCFVHTNDFLSGDSGNVEVSTNGLDWTSFLSVTGQSTDWQQERFSLAAFAGSPSVYLRFRVSTGPSGQADGWHIDDISVAESPDVIDAPLISDIQSHSMRLSWNIAAPENFSHYAVYRDADASVDFNSTLVATVTDRTNLTVLATGLALDTDYHFRVYAVSIYGTYSPDGTTSSAHTLNNPIPFFADFESSLESWNLTGAWAADDSMPHSGTMSLGDSPRRSYSNNVNSSAQTAVDLTGSDWPVLKFWDRYQIAGGDYVSVEVSPNGVNWYPRYVMRESLFRTEWKQNVIDLSEWKNESNLRIRFRFVSNYDAATTADGWNIDDVEVVDYTPPAAATLPFVDGYEDGATNWLNSTWAVISNDVHGGTMALLDKPNRYMIDEASVLSVLGREFDLSGAVTPTLTYWIKGWSDYYKSTFRWEVSENGGESWTDVPGTPTSGNYADWTRIQATLDTWKGKTIRLRARTYTSDGSGVSYTIDDVAINEQPPNTVLYPPIPHLKSMDLKWDPSPISDFKRIEIYRDTSPNVDLSDVPIGSFTNVATTNLTDTGLSIGQTYYYRLFVVNSNDCYSTGLEQFNTTVPIQYPLTDDMETIANWDVTENWGVDTLYKHNGSASFGDSPGGPYSPNQDNYILTAVDLTGSDWPVLKFWDRYQIAGGDYVSVEVSPNGVNWYPRYFMRESLFRTEWKQNVIDLSEWKNESNLRIRFHFVSNYDADTTADGWNIDDVEVVDYTPPAAATLPFVDGYEDGATNWLNSTWAVISNDVHGGTMALLDKPNRYMIDEASVLSVLGREFDLSGAVTPTLTYWIKGWSDYYKSTFRWEVSENGGESWTDVPGTPTSGNYADWTRIQATLDTWKGKTIRLRARTYTSDGSGVSYTIDDVAINEQPPNTVLYPPIPHLKSMDLKWDPSPISDFKRIEIYRDTSPNVDLSDVPIGSFTNVATTNLTDTGLSIGQTYYYRLFVVNSNDCYSTGLEQFNTTVPIQYPLTDDMETIANWDVTENWGVDTLYKHNGSASFGDSPGGPYATSQNSYILTAVDLTGSDWPVLKFWDRYQIAGGDYVSVEVSPNGVSWYPRYFMRESLFRTEWKQNVIDLSEWKNESNLRIRFRFVSNYDADTTADGWNIDDVEVVDYTPPAAATLPFVDGYEDGATNWLNSTWAVISNDVHGGTMALLDKPNRYMIDEASVLSVLGREFDLSAAVTPTLTYWIKGWSDYHKSTFRWEVSENGGVSWTDVPGTPTSGNYADWTRIQATLDTWKGKTIRLRARTYTSDGSGVSYTIDDVAINEQPPNTVLYPPIPHLKSMDLKWDPSPISDFKRIEIYRDTSPNVDLSDVPIGSFTNVATTNLTDTGLSIGQTYYYRLFVVNSNDCYSTGNEQFATTVPITYPLTDDMESVSNWYATVDSWGVDPLHKHSGSHSMGDSPNSSYGTSENSYLLTSLDLTGSDWPVLKFWDRYQIAGGDYACVEVSPNGVNWYPRYFMREAVSRTEWKQNVIDLSEWKNESNLRIRFRFVSNYDAATTADGWNIDDVEVLDYTPPAVADYPFFEDYEDGATNWLNSTWAVISNDVHGGTMALLDKPNRYMIDEASVLSVLGREFDLSAAVTPTLTYWIKGWSDYYKSTFRWEVSENGGVSWTDVPGTPTSGNYADWTRIQATLDTWKGKTIRLRARTYTSDGSGVSYAIDDVGVGEPAPGAPVPLSPQDGISVTSLRPTLIVRNAIDAQGDELTYEFEVFTDSALSNRVANVPAIASGVSNTSWQVDLNLLDNQPYWWRCRAHDGTTNGPWSTVFNLYVNHENLPPNPVTLYGPPRASILHGLSYELSWFPTTDPDLNDTIVAYHVQIADNPEFTTPVVDDSTVPPPSSIPAGGDWVLTLPLSDLDSSGLVPGTIYYWRMRAVDEVGDWSEWSAGDWYFEYGTPPIQIHSSLSGGVMRMNWELTGAQVQLQHSTSLTDPDWQPVGSPTWGNELELSIPEGASSGLYRLIVVE